MAFYVNLDAPVVFCVNF